MSSAYVFPCLVPRPHYSAQPKRFGSRGPIENVRTFPDRSPRIRHRNELTERDWENAVQGLGNVFPIFLENDLLKVDNFVGLTFFNARKDLEGFNTALFNLL